MNQQFFYVSAGKRHGPIEVDHLKSLAASGELLRTDKVWCQGMDGWQKAETISRLFEDLPPDLQAEPQPIPTRQYNIISSDRTTMKHADAKQVRNWRQQGALYCAAMGAVAGQRMFREGFGTNWAAVIGCAAVGAVIGYVLGMLAEYGEKPNGES